MNAVAPGLTLGERVERRLQNSRDVEKQQMVEAIPLKRLGSLGEIASVIVFLASDESNYITGATIDVNGSRLLI